MRVFFLEGAFGRVVLKSFWRALKGSSRVMKCGGAAEGCNMRMRVTESRRNGFMCHKPGVKTHNCGILGC